MKTAIALIFLLALAEKEARASCWKQYVIDHYGVSASGVVCEKGYEYRTRKDVAHRLPLFTTDPSLKLFVLCEEKKDGRCIFSVVDEKEGR